MKKSVIAIASDHAGFDLKTSLKAFLSSYASQILDLGADSPDAVDYPEYGHAIAQAVVSKKAEYGVAICGSGIGIAVAANRHKGVRAALCADGLYAALSRRHNDANVLCLGARIIGIETAKDCVHRFFTTDFEGGRHEERLMKLDN